jgi:hypothetical protein
MPLLMTSREVEIVAGLVFTLAFVLGLMVLFGRAGRSPLLALVPFYNSIVLCEIAGVSRVLGVLMVLGTLIPESVSAHTVGDGGMLLLHFLHAGSIGLSFAVIHAISKRSGHGVGMTVLLVLGIGFYFVTPGRRRRRDAWEEPDDRLNDDQHDDFDLPIAERIRRERTNRADARASVKKALERRKRWRTADSSLPPPASGEDERHLSEDERKRRDEIRLRLARRARLRARDA